MEDTTKGTPSASGAGQMTDNLFRKPRKGYLKLYQELKKKHPDLSIKAITQIVDYTLDWCSK